MEKQRKIQIANELLVYLGINARKLSDELGLNSSQWYYDILNQNKPNGFSRERAGKIASRWPEIDPNYLFTGEGSLLKNSNGPVSVGGDQNGNVNSPGASCSVGLDKLIGVVGQQSVQISELIKQNQDLINIISNLSTK